MAFFFFVISRFVLEIFKLSYYANNVIDDVTSCASTVVRHKIKNISANNKAMRLKLSRDVAPYPDGHFDVAIVTCSVPVSFLFKINLTICSCIIVSRVTTKLWVHGARYAIKNVQEETQWKVGLAYV